MLPVDAFIGWFLRLKSRQYLTFEDTGRIDPAPAPDDPVHLYLHVPFCARLCPYCSFHRVGFEEGLARAYFTALREEIRIYHRLGYRFSDVYVGGGTPTILVDELLETLELLNQLFRPGNISVETNPDRIEPQLLETLAQAGVSRVSVGVQTFDDAILKLIDRYDKYGSGVQIAERIQAAQGIVRTLNIDMIYNFPVQTLKQLEADLMILNRLLPDQITFYPLMISDATLSEMTGIMGRHSLRRERRYYETITRSLARGYRPGSAWCFSRSQGMIDEYIVNHDEYVGAGSGAFGLVAGAIYANTFSIPEYIRIISEGRLPLKARKLFSPKELARYTFLMDLFGLRMDRAAFQRKFGRDVWRVLFIECLFFTLIGALTTNRDALNLTPRGQYDWVIMMREFFIGVDNFRDFSRALKA